MMVRYFKGDPGQYVTAFRGGKVVAEGVGASFFFLPATTTLSLVPITSRDAQFVIKESTADYQDVVVQGSLTYRITDPKQALQALDLSIHPASGRYRTDDHQRLESRIVNALQGQARPILRTLPLEASLKAANQLAADLLQRLATDPALMELGVRIESIYVVQITPTPELKKALEAEYRENLNRRADQAIYARRTAALEEERKLKQTELDTEIEIEEGRKALVATQTENNLKLAEAEARAVELKLDPYAKLPPAALVALAFREWAAANPDIGQLNVSPDLLTALSGWIGQRQGAG